VPEADPKGDRCAKTALHEGAFNSGCDDVADMTRITRIGVHPSITAFDPPTLVDALSDVTPEVVVDDSVETVAECDALVTLHHREAFLEAGLEWIHLPSAGVDHFPVERYRRAGVVVTNSSGVHSECMAENALGLMLTHAHRLREFYEGQDEREWRRDVAWREKFTLHGEPATVVGLGAIGGTVADYAARVGMRVTGVKRTPDTRPALERVVAPEDLHAAVEDARFVVLCVPLTEDTRRLFSTPEFERMREDAFLINVSRGDVVDEMALVDAIERGEIRGAALDVFETEPLPEESPLWGMEEVYVMPHVSGAFRDYYAKVADLVRENLSRIEDDRSLVNQVT
jgi:D-2-hydroxyacid dehydrogenase (NADP+)